MFWLIVIIANGLYKISCVVQVPNLANAKQIENPRDTSEANWRSNFRKPVLSLSKGRLELAINYMRC